MPSFARKHNASTNKMVKKEKNQTIFSFMCVYMCVESHFLHPLELDVMKLLWKTPELHTKTLPDNIASTVVFGLTFCFPFLLDIGTCRALVYIVNTQFIFNTTLLLRVRERELQHVLHVTIKNNYDRPHI